MFVQKREERVKVKEVINKRGDGKEEINEVKIGEHEM